MLNRAQLFHAILQRSAIGKNMTIPQAEEFFKQFIRQATEKTKALIKSKSREYSSAVRVEYGHLLTPFVLKAFDAMLYVEYIESTYQKTFKDLLDLNLLFEKYCEVLEPLMEEENPPRQDLVNLVLFGNIIEEKYLLSLSSRTELAKIHDSIKEIDQNSLREYERFKNDIEQLKNPFQSVEDALLASIQAYIEIFQELGLAMHINNLPQKYNEKNDIHDLFKNAFKSINEIFIVIFAITCKSKISFEESKQLIEEHEKFQNHVGEITDEERKEFEKFYADFNPLKEVAPAPSIPQKKPSTSSTEVSPSGDNKYVPASQSESSQSGSSSDSDSKTSRVTNFHGAFHKPVPTKETTKVNHAEVTTVEESKCCLIM